MSEGARILIVDDEAPIRRFLRTSLSAQGYRVSEALRGGDAVEQFGASKPDLMILDLGLPDLDGVEIISRVREWSRTPIIVLSARNLEKDKIAALGAGANDYLTKPFGIGELLARVRAALRQSFLPGEEPVFESGELKVDLARRSVLRGGEELKLSPTEYAILRVLVLNAGKVVTHRQILREVWGPGYVDEAHYVRVYMGLLRQKIERNPSRPQFIHSEPGVGYRLRVVE
jgi:two-component system, OmpR family, KDP operon response regulator KdpE